MFENIIGHRDVVSQLMRDIASSSFPASSLIVGPAYSGKLTLALEIARVLSCQREGAWSCSCSSCNRQRFLMEPRTVVVGRKDFMREIRAAWDTLNRDCSLGPLYLFIRSVRKLLKRFEPFLWEDEESRIRDVSSAVASVSESLEAFFPVSSSELPDVMSDKLQKAGNKIVKNCQTLSSSLPSDGVPASVIRRIVSLVHHSTASVPHVVIIENADYLNEAARNALLKVLEEPPSSCYFILLSRKRSGIIPTILSRVRPYVLFDRSEEDMTSVLRRVFKVDNGYSHLAEFFLSFMGIQEDGLVDKAKAFVAAVRGDASVDYSGIEVPKDDWSVWFELVLELLRKELSSLEPWRLDLLSQVMRDMNMSVSELNISPVSAIEAAVLAFEGCRG
ncbi:hypothetical protein WKV44_09800 [Spirochaetia bacterium 38H-sp]|uniref:DNA polymerase III n=1 Tax=Rarispira pelagica TaxID=3141764 RepID=A0ABU9UDS8_9SPIR